MEPPKILQPWEDKNPSNFQMVDVTAKNPTLRRAQAVGAIRMSEKAFALVRDGQLPKGDALKLAEVAGLMATKQTSVFLPLCHPIPIEQVKVTCTLDEKRSAVEVACLVSTTAKTGVEMEALMGVNGALLCLYDVIKMVEPALTIETVRLDFKEGGKLGLWNHPESQTSKLDSVSISKYDFSEVSCAVMTVSDRVSRNEAQDLSGPIAKKWLEDRGATAIEVGMVPDDKTTIKDQMLKWCEKRISLVVISGGTGLGPRDVTIETLLQLHAKEMRGIGEILRREGSRLKKSAVLSNA
ncbi:MAG: cyclic pyranopterin monophosphate synthase MoaC, partial [Deltaproteobacteria bacterium]